MCVYIYIYIYLSLSLSLYIYIYICIEDFWPAWEAWGEDYYMTHCPRHSSGKHSKHFYIYTNHLEYNMFVFT